jgi:hypothetical protein
LEERREYEIGRSCNGEFKELKMFFKSVNRRRKPQEKLEVVVKDGNGEMLNEKGQVVESFSKYFESLLSV